MEMPKRTKVGLTHKKKGSCDIFISYNLKVAIFAVL